MTRRLALFDLDNTLLAGDSDHAWGEFLISKNIVDESKHRAEHDKYHQQYQDGNLDIDAYEKFTLSPLLEFRHCQRNKFQKKFKRKTS